MRNKIGLFLVLLGISTGVTLRAADDYDRLFSYSGIYGMVSATYSSLFLAKTDIKLTRYAPSLLDASLPDPGTRFDFKGKTSGMFPAPSGIGVALTLGFGASLADGLMYAGGEAFAQYLGGTNDSQMYIHQVDAQYGGTLTKLFFYAQIKTQKILALSGRIGTVLDGTLLYLRGGYRILEGHTTITYGAKSDIASVAFKRTPGEYISRSILFNIVEIGVGAERKITTSFSVRGEMTFGSALNIIPLTLDGKFNKLESTMTAREMVLTVGINYFFHMF